MSDGSRHEGRFGTWALARFGQHKNIDLAGIGEALAKVQMMDLLEFFTFAVEAITRERGLQPSFNTMKMAAWLDENPGGLQVLLEHMQGDGEEKKSQETAP